MKTIDQLADKISEEISDAESYIRCAIMAKESDPVLAEVYYKLSTEEIQHSQMLHEQIVRLINAYRKEHGDPPPAMQARYDYIHEKHIQHSTSVKQLQMIYKSPGM